jgi:hypothetical protein
MPGRHEFVAAGVCRGLRQADRREYRVVREKAGGTLFQPLARDQRMVRIGRRDAVSRDDDRIASLVGVRHRCADAAMGVQAGHHQHVGAERVQQRIEPAGFEAAEIALFDNGFAIDGSQ